MIKASSLALLLLMPPQPESAWRCDFTATYQCNASTGCTPVENTVYTIIYPEYSTYMRCNNENCASYEATFGSSGDYMIVRISKSGSFAKIGADLKITEVASIGASAVWTAFGQCHETAPPPVITPVR